MAKLPGDVREFLMGIPTVWDDLRFLEGFPGGYVVLARRSGDGWYVAGINGEPTPRELPLDLGRLAPGASGVLITDGEAGNLSFRCEAMELSSDQEVRLTLKASWRLRDGSAGLKPRRTRRSRRE